MIGQKLIIVQIIFLFSKLSHGSKDRHISTTASTQATSSLLALMSDVDEEGAAGTSKAAVPSAGGQSQDITSSPDVASGLCEQEQL